MIIIIFMINYIFMTFYDHIQRMSHILKPSHTFSDHARYCKISSCHSVHPSVVRRYETIAGHPVRLRRCLGDGTHHFRDLCAGAILDRQHQPSELSG